MAGASSSDKAIDGNSEVSNSEFMQDLYKKLKTKPHVLTGYVDLEKGKYPEGGIKIRS